MAIAILVGRDDTEKQSFNWFIQEWKRVLLNLNPNLDIRIWPDVGSPDEIDTVLVWRHPYGVLKQLPKLKLIASLAAGVDHVMTDPDLPIGISIVRLTDPYMANDIVQYVLAYLLNHIKRIDHWASYQQEKLWSRKPPFNYSDKTIGIMGLGFLGAKAAHALANIGLNVTGWSYSPKILAHIKTYAGKSEFSEFLNQTDILICMLPLTNETQDILNKTTFEQLPQGAYIMNIGRGEHLVEPDLLQALASGQLSGACLDVFRQEPLPADHPFWSHPNIRVTPHIASVTNPKTAAPQVLDNYERMQKGQPLINEIDSVKGY